MSRFSVQPGLQAAVTIGALLAASACSAGRSGPPASGPASGRPQLLTSAVPSPTGRPAAFTFGLPKYPDALVDASGRAVYVFSGDGHGDPTCTGACAEQWPPVLTVGTPRMLSGTNQCGTVARGNGSWQATYGAWPLYYYSGDKTPGRATGAGMNSFDGKWFLISRNATLIA